MKRFVCLLVTKTSSSKLIEDVSSNERDVVNEKYCSMVVPHPRIISRILQDTETIQYNAIHYEGNRKKKDCVRRNQLELKLTS